MRLRRPANVYRKQECTHDWQIFRETIKVENGDYTIAHLGQPKPYFVVKACTKCKRKRYLNMVTE